MLAYTLFWNVDDNDAVDVVRLNSFPPPYSPLLLLLLLLKLGVLPRSIKTTTKLLICLFSTSLINYYDALIDVLYGEH